jgi:SAM-dependent methyltransferase
MTEHDLGIALGQQLLGLQDLQYGLWDEELELNIANLAKAQRRFANLIASELPDPSVHETHVLDTGCGAGYVLSLLTQRGYQVDAASPSHFLIEQVKHRLTEFPGSTSKVFETDFENFPEKIYQQYYDVILFNESFHQIPMQRAFSKAQKLLKPGGLTIICDAFLAADAANNAHNALHKISDFYRFIGQSPFSLIRDEDITRFVAPNIELMEEFVTTKLKPASESLGIYLHSNNPVLIKIGSFLFKKKLHRLNDQYFSRRTGKALLDGSASYHFIVLQLVKPV